MVNPSCSPSIPQTPRQAHAMTMPTPRIFDISPPVSAQLAVWPGDTPLRRELLCEIQRGDAVTLSSLHATAHLGAHADAPSHIGAGAPTIDERPLDHYLGPCQ